MTPSGLQAPPAPTLAFAQRADQAPIEVEPLDEPVGVERHGTTIRGPEGRNRTAGADQRARCDRVEGTQPHVRLAVEIGDEQNLPAVCGHRKRREKERVGDVRRDVEPHLGRRSRPSRVPQARSDRHEAEEGNDAGPGEPLGSGPWRGPRSRRDGIRLLRLIDLEPRVSHGEEPIGFTLLQTPAEQSSDGLGRLWRKVPPIGVLGEHVSQDLARRGGAEGAPAGQHLEQQTAEGPDV